MMKLQILIERLLVSMRQPEKEIDYKLCFEDTPNAVILKQWIKHTVTRKRKSNENRAQTKKRFNLKSSN